MKALVVVQPFADHAKGDRITDPATIQKILVDHGNRVLKIEIPDAPTTPPPSREDNPA